MDEALNPDTFMPSLAMGGAMFLAVWWLFAALQSTDLQQAQDEWRYDISRINQLRRHDSLFRMFQVVIQFFARLNRTVFRDQLPEVQRQIQAAGLSRFWLPEEYLGRMQLMSLMMLPVYLYFSMHYLGAMGIVTAVTLSALTAWLLRRRLAKQAEYRLVLIKRRLPFFLDLLTLLIEAGSSFTQALKQAVIEFEGHPVAVEFNRVLTDMNMGKARTEAFDNLRQRLKDDEITAIVGSIIQSETLGTPISSIFRTQADVLRIKRSQRAETIAGEAGVNMLLPGILVMASTVIIILGPFILRYFVLEGL